MKFRFISILLIILYFSCNKDSSYKNDSDCANNNHELICWTVIDDITEKPIPNASGTIWYGMIVDFIVFNGNNNGYGCFCFPIGGIVHDGFIRADGYEQLDLKGFVITNNTIRLTPID